MDEIRDPQKPEAKEFEKLENPIQISKWLLGKLAYSFEYGDELRKTQNDFKLIKALKTQELVTTVGTSTTETQNAESRGINRKID
ncbi:hypothetical protein TWF569_010487 [Orbilia oligospora]|uniref:Uncharacterized protein n=1 Tax=Orbilia oligospora TaxID=2813651 RepID=A0A7C8NSE7_ORBOL|nr:hypothetical protein TWF102_004022 [Orbilia oligospora]KAF3080196.1 hypothetical protein TWF103_004238 [Orbilia oligospora]KAF3129566.1 hypothetical protein TWF703_008853 [Orbilia oligospora]KAF3133517.1 hypothetical protein TWF569_010487 [Orbilia oligospora]KAF3143530.1 hypothetical protein TWF594_005085 [Orbilia oligospora]